MSFSQPTVLMCPPPAPSAADAHQSECDLHEWGTHPCPFDTGRAAAQWESLRTTLESLAVDVRTIPVREGLPDLMFTSDTALIDGRRAVVSRFRHRQRCGEAGVMSEWLSRAGFEVVNVPAEYDFEGGGQAVACGRAIFGGWFLHRELLALEWLGQTLDRPVVPLRLASDRFDRLDSCFRPLSDGVALYVPGAFDARGRALLEEHVGTLIPVCNPEATRMAASAVAVGRVVLLPSSCPQTAAAVEAAGFEVRTVDVDAFAMLGGGINGLMLRLDTAHNLSSPGAAGRGKVANPPAMSRAVALA